jgi:hypothetical protein
LVCIEPSLALLLAPLLLISLLVLVLALLLPLSPLDELPLESVPVLAQAASAAHAATRIACFTFMISLH